MIGWSVISLACYLMALVFGNVAFTLLIVFLFPEDGC